VETAAWHLVMAPSAEVSNTADQCGCAAAGIPDASCGGGGGGGRNTCCHMPPPPPPLSHTRPLLLLQVLDAPALGPP